MDAVERTLAVIGAVTVLALLYMAWFLVSTYISRRFGDAWNGGLDRVYRWRRKRRGYLKGDPPP